MRKTTVTFCGLNCVVWAQTPDFESPHHPSHVLVQFQSGVNEASRSTAHGEAEALRVLESYSEFDGLQLVEVAEGGVEDAVYAYLENPNVLVAEPDYERYSTAECNSNDLYLVTGDRLWSMRKIRAPEAWCAETGDEDMLVAVIDHGIHWDHPDLTANIWTNPIECPGGMLTCAEDYLDDDGNGYADDFYGWNFVAQPNNNDVFDTLVEGFHGTHIAGTIGGVGNNEIGLVGVNWRVKLVALKILPPGGPTYASRVIAALNYCVQKNIKVSNNSYVGNGLSVTECAAIQAAGDAIGHIFVAAAGNGGVNLDESPMYPASCQASNMITVTATDEADYIGCMKWVRPLSDPPVCANYANYGAQTIHLGAPGATNNPWNLLGGGVWSTWYEPNVSPPILYHYKVGTSMAAPHVTGAVALTWVRYPTWTYQQIKSAILGSVHKSTLADVTITGGRLDVAGAILDCNHNGVPDGIDLNTGEVFDCNENNVPDDCEGLGSCCIPSEDCFECTTKQQCHQMEGGFWDSGGTCLVCAMRPRA